MLGFPTTTVAASPPTLTSLASSAMTTTSEPASVLSAIRIIDPAVRTASEKRLDMSHSLSSGAEGRKHGLIGCPHLRQKW